MDTRIGYPNEHLAGDSDQEIASPLYATAVGLVMDGIRRQQRRLQHEQDLNNDSTDSGTSEIEDQDSETPEAPVRDRRSLLDKLTERLKEFLDNAE